MTFALVIALAAVFAIASPLGVATAQSASDATPDGEEGEKDYKDGEHKEGKSCPNKEKRQLSQQQQSS